MKYIIANWKLNMDAQKINTWWSEFQKLIPQTGTSGTRIILSPSFADLEHTSALIQDHKNIFLAAQDISVYTQGAHTGEVSAEQIQKYCKYCIVGHSERHEKFEDVIKKRDNCLSFGITPIVCLRQPDEAGKYYAAGAILAWEDPQNISAGGVYNEKDPALIKETACQIKSILPQNTVLIYGGSVNRQNISSLANIYELEGVLVGNASLDPGHFFEIIKAL